MRPPVDDLSAGQLAIGETHLGRSEVEPRRQAVVEKLKELPLVRRLVGEE